ncbi:NAD(P)-dependent oxidoreductase [Campylobacter sp. RM16188]|uniref:NAD(P)-dependent oxidoreductase n=1 Tax=Campylobacter sp. RM16188 TaxID=1705725 RepID=UPI001551A835|nr:NAD(P)H-binding protein [Campylobacter sp. RM16188]
MKKVAIIGANGKSGKELVKEALLQGYEVIAIVRNKEYNNDQVKVIYKDVFELNKEDLSEFDVVISAFAVWTKETFHLHAKHTKHLADLLSSSKTRLFIVGGAGTLYVDSDHKVMLMDAPDFPTEYLDVAKADAGSFYELKDRKDTLWTYVSPALNYDEGGARTGKYKIGSDELILNSSNQSYISYPDLALAIIDEIKNQNHINRCLTAVSG